MTSARSVDHHDDYRIGFKSHLRATVVPGEACYLVSDREILALSGASAEVLMPLLDGTRTLDGVLRDAAPRLATDQARTALSSLEAAGLVRSRPRRTVGAPTADSEAYWDLIGLDGGAASAALARARVQIVALGGFDTRRVRASCLDAGVAVAAPGEGADFTLVVCADYLAPELARINSLHRAAGMPWLLVRPGADPWIGPVFRPDDGPCWSCLATRLRGHRRAERPLQRHLGLTGPVPRPVSSSAAGESSALHLAILETAKWLAGVRHPTQSSVRVLDSLELSTSVHPVTRLPQCPVCGDPGLVARRVDSPFVPVSRPKTSVESNGDRALTPQQMLEKYGHLIDRVTGVVKEIKRAPHSPDFLHAFLSGPNLALAPQSLTGVRASVRALSGGKGLSEPEARTGALCEAIERYSGTRQGDEPVVWDSYRALGDSAVHPYACQLYDESQLRDREGWNAGGSALHHVPPPFAQDRPTEWTPMWSLTGRVQRLLPTSLLYFSDTPAPDGLFADSNGNAAGSSPEDAVLQGFLEVVERDAVALWWYNQTRQPGVVLEEPYVDQLREGYRQLGREIWALDLTSDFGIPVTAALSRRIDGPAQEVIFGFGAHFDPKIALRRALTEMGQLLPAVARGNAGTHRVSDPVAVRWWRRATTANQPYLLPDSAVRARTAEEWGYEPRADLLHDIDIATELVRKRGMELLVLDQTRPDLQLPVTKVVIPGMRHFWPRFAPGRLFDVPVALQRRRTQTLLNELNPIPMFI
jgi:ribosomal protein S12 methylthiotransferase accessory factor